LSEVDISAIIANDIRLVDEFLPPIHLELFWKDLVLTDRLYLEVKSHNEQQPICCNLYCNLLSLGCLAVSHIEWLKLNYKARKHFLQVEGKLLTSSVPRLVSNLKSFEEKFVIVNAKVLKSHVNI
jgi:hypothetical protein